MIDSPWTVVIPVKRLDRAKTRLHPVALRPALALAFALDTVRAAIETTGVRGVIVVTSDSRVAAAVATIGATVIPDPGDGLNPAVRIGVATASTAAVAVLLGDLPSLRPDDLAAALRVAAGYPLAVVPDREGSGTTLLTSTGGGMHPRFGHGSRARHESGGHLVIPVTPLSTLRRDVDTVQDLASAIELGVGVATAAILERCRQ